MSFLLHQHRVHENFQPALLHQQQAILRNTSTPDGGAWQLSLLIWYWRKRADKSLQRTLPLIAIAILNLSVFGVAGIFSSDVTKAAGNETLIMSPICGQLNVEGSDKVVNLDGYRPLIANEHAGGECILATMLRICGKRIAT